MLSPITMSEERLLYLEQRVTTQMDRFEGLLQRMECISKTMQVGQCEFLTTANSEVNFFDFMCRVIDELKRSCRMGTAESYQSAMASFKQFIGLPDIAIDHINNTNNTCLGVAWQKIPVRFTCVFYGRCTTGPSKKN